jgi:hypothetical protein
MTIILLIFQFLALAEAPPQKENNLDLREDKTLFSLHDAKNNSLRNLKIGGSEYKLTIGSEERKTEQTFAVEIDKEFASLFLRLQYEVDSPLKVCDKNYQLVLRNEILKICEKDEQRTRLIAEFLNKFNSF